MMKKYFFIIGLIEIISVTIIAVIYFIFILNCIEARFDPYTLFLLFTGLFFIVFFGPALGFLFLSHSDSLPSVEKVILNKSEINNNEIIQYYDCKNKILNVGDVVKCVNETLIKQSQIDDLGEIAYLKNGKIGVIFHSSRGTFTLNMFSEDIKKIS